MGINKEELQKRLLATFKVEAEEHFSAISSGLVELEQGNTDILETIFREAHSLKGAARAVNLVEIERVCQSIESVFSDLKQHRLEITQNVMDNLHQAMSGLRIVLSGKEQTSSDSPKEKADEIVRVLDRTRQSEPQEISSEPSHTEKSGGVTKESTIPFPTTVDTVRISSEKLNAVLLQTEELLTEKAIKTQQANELAEIYNQLSVWKKEWNKIRSEVRSIQNGNGSRSNCSSATLKKLVQFLDWNRNTIESLDYDMMKLTQSVRRSQRIFDGMVDNLLEDVKTISMLPFSTILESFPPFVREISREKGKDVTLEIRGESIEVDRRILESLKDPLLHLLRNCVDHGIETPEIRKSLKKPARGTIAIEITFQEGRYVEVLVSDDGAGVDIAAVKAGAIRHGLFKPDEIEFFDEQRILSLIFQSGISTSAFITDISGRGLGLAIVREKIDRLRGEITVESQVHVGTTFRMLLPMTFATLRGTIIQLENMKFVIPSNSIDCVLKIPQEKIKTVENQETIPLLEKTIPLVQLAAILEIHARNMKRGTDRSLNIIVISAEERTIAFEVDEILEDREILVKPLGPQLERVRHIAGATVLGSGRVVPILNVTDLMYSATSDRVDGTRPVEREQKREESVTQSILVVEDSITSRILIKTILETAGYRVETAVDGIDGYTKLQGGQFDLVVTDVDMPGMNGFSLTEKIRGSHRFSEMPVVLVTALESREDRERGIDVGASAYIVKSSFDQSNLLETIQRLL